MEGKYYIAVDCEGCACVVGEPGVGLGDGVNYAFAREQATKEANAAATALFDAGAKEVIVWDAHHSGVNLFYDKLDKRCKILMGSGHKGRFVGIDDSFSGILFIGYHARENTAGAVLAHSYSSVAYQHIKINGLEVGEMEIDAAYAGQHGVPVLFLAGDHACVQEAKEMFGDIGTVETKTALSWSSAISKQPDLVCDEIYATVQESVKRQSSASPFRITGPVEVEIRYKRMDRAGSVSLYDQDGRPFKLSDPFTRVGTLRSITDLF